MTIISKAFKFQTKNGEFVYPCTMRRKNLKASPEMFRTSSTGGNILDESEFEVDEETMIHQVLNLGYSVRMANDKGEKNLYSPNENKIIK
ncbi:hypothetical protein [Acinetobacter baumannii]|uniref:hypothetical protein n=1 Tax=Acinetobacter baumannii TaxID=470 RepID=UPI002340281A|nr:hypothetical protein [Acinetobacter baumannii]MDC5019711.1 hypothetical protein [Acinetobacter baumannii]MDE5409347.1 hypothetical protein [Acinetobacter baumannii]MDV7589344.1 hypothetical protein [Acinetobacter baumannii]HCA5151344.1 hypothetical protein [Acinetobacter baumannii]